MMPIRPDVSVLFVDDDRNNFESIRRRLENNFRQLGCTVGFTFQADPDVACDDIERRHPAYDIIIVDLLFPPRHRPDTPPGQQEPRGLEVVEQARGASADSVIVVLSGVDNSRRHLEEDARDGAADIFLHRDSLLTGERYGGITQLVKDMHGRLCDRGLLEVGPAVGADDEPGIQSALHDIGPTNIRLLVNDLFSARDDTRPQRVDVTYLTPGASGAHVLRAETTSTDGSRRHLLIKISRDGDSLWQEMVNSGRMFGLYNPSLVVQHKQLEGRPPPRNGWSAIAMLFADNATTLRQWLREETSAPLVVDVLRHLFLNRGLAAQYGNRCNRADRPGAPAPRPMDRLTLPTFRRVLVGTAAERLAPVLVHPDGGNVADTGDVLRVVREFARDGRVAGVSAADTPGDLWEVNAHGDLHGGNVLVCTDQPARPLLIDFAAFGAHHWAADPARLMVDILLRSLDSSVESYLWRRLPAWRSLIADAGGLEGSLDDDMAENAAVVAALNWMADERSSLLPLLADDDRWWEWHVAMAEQLLRGTYQVDLPPAKRAVALVAAHDQLVLAARKMPRGPVTF